MQKKPVRYYRTILILFHQKLDKLFCPPDRLPSAFFLFPAVYKPLQPAGNIPEQQRHLPPGPDTCGQWNFIDQISWNILRFFAEKNLRSLFTPLQCTYITSQKPFFCRGIRILNQRSFIIPSAVKVKLFRGAPFCPLIVDFPMPDQNNLHTNAPYSIPDSSFSCFSSFPQGSLRGCFCPSVYIRLKENFKSVSPRK